MDKDRKVDFLIVGGGVAGLLLAWKLREHNIRLLTGTFPAASEVAAGVLNPVSGRRLARVPDFEEYRAEAERTYTRIPGAEDCFRETVIRRYFRNPSEVENFEQRQQKAGFQDYLGTRCPPGGSGLPISDPLGCFEINGAGVVEIPTLLDHIRSRITHSLVQEDADWATLETSGAGTRLNGIRARRLICCDGAAAVRNPLFRWLPFRPVGGETLTVRLDGVPDFDEVIQHGKWILSLGKNRFRIGSTYEKVDLGGEGLKANKPLPAPTPSQNARSSLLEAVRSIFPTATDVKILDQKAGIRPASRDRLPYLGPHPSYPDIMICNGLGSKGTLYAPLLCEKLANHLLNGDPLPEKWLPERMVRRGFDPTTLPDS